jgi:hypothetical protein
MSEEAGLVRQLKDGSGFWLPNSLVDSHDGRVGARAFLLYCRLLRSTTLRHYPSLQDLVKPTRMSRKTAVLAIRRLAAAGLLNAHDLDAIGGYREAEATLILSGAADLYPAEAGPESPSEEDS